MDIRKKASLIGGLVGMATKTTFSYYSRGPRCHTWPLWFQLYRDAIFYIIKSTAHVTASEQTIDSIDFDALYASNRKNDLPTSKMPAHMGRFERGRIPVKEVHIDIAAFANTGPAEAGLVRLTKDDQRSGTREIAYDMLVPKTLVKTKNAFDCKPLEQNERIVLYMHGGAYTMGSPASHRGVTGRLVHHSGVRCIAIDYRLAPRYPFPAQLHDAYIAYHYLVKQGFKPKNIVLAGDSAGGNLSISLTLLLRHIGAPPPGGLLLISPWVDVISERPSMLANIKYDYLYPLPLENPMCLSRVFYAPGRRLTDKLREELKHPLVSPIYADFSDFPPTLIQVGSKEIMFDDVDEMHRRMLASDQKNQTNVVYERYPDMIHVFHQFADLPCAQEAYVSIGSFINRL
ncbi:hypothetical protein GGI15_002274 [Coemansia interrupta]|uniref:Alpha/beta hydrolase fold-3 domain-containing protein n=1 Tax=Coemansia interrupta TaxID=1126814 RepID=A0A9W8HFX5_9FUNG|nr:hypothetical protein GGI15_002274 [Coemansia interrupta]